MPTFADVLNRRAREDRPGLIFEAQTWSWREVIVESRRRAALAMRWSAANRGEPVHIAVMLDNVPEFLFWLFAAALSRTTVVGINTTRRGAELGADIRHTRCTVLITDREHAPLLDGVGAGVDAARTYLIDNPSYAEVLTAVDPEAVLPTPEAVLPTPEASDQLLLLFTSGSTGAPKAVICTSGRLARIAATSAPMFGVTRDDVCYQAMPMFHGNAIMANIAPATEVGASVVLRRRFSASGFLPDVREHGATYFNYVGRSLAYILATAPTALDRDNRLRLGFGTEATAQDREQFTARFGCRLMETYGSSEGVVSMHLTPDSPAASIGVPNPIPGSDVAVVDPDDRQECEPAQFDSSGRLLNPTAAIGEIVNRGGAIGFEGYFDNGEATLERVRGGWYWTGDLGYRDAAGFFYFAGRTSDRLRVDSENFAAAPIERILQRHPSVALAAVYPVPDPRTGDQVMAALELVPGMSLDSRELDEFLTDQSDLGTKWAPRFVRIVDEIPVTGNNKVAKAGLRAQRWDAEAVWWRQPGQSEYAAMTAHDRQALRAEFRAHNREHVLDANV